MEPSNFPIFNRGMPKLSPHKEFNSNGSTTSLNSDYGGSRKFLNLIPSDAGGAKFCLVQGNEVQGKIFN